MSNLKLLFGKYSDGIQKNEAGVSCLKESLNVHIPLKVKLVLECIKDNKYFSDPLFHACDDHTYAIMDNDVCIGTAFYATSFHNEVNYQIDIHPDLANNVGENQVFSYFKEAIILMENLFKTIGYHEAKVWLCEDDIFIEQYKEAGYIMLDNDTNLFDEDMTLFSHIFK